LIANEMESEPGYLLSFWDANKDKFEIKVQKVFCSGRMGHQQSA
jgi:hypothetical protein